MTTAHLLTYLLPPTSTALGRLTTSPHRPHQHFHDPLPPRPNTTETHTAHHTDFRETRTFTKRSRLSVGLADLLSLRFTTTSTGAATLAAPQTTTSDLQNSDGWFAEACGQEATQRWMQAAARRGDSVYLVVGIRSACNASFTSERAGGGSAGVLAVVPGTAVLAPEGAAGGQWGGEGQVGMKAVGEMVYAVLYRKVRLRTVFAKSVEGGAAVLEGGCRWREVWDWTMSQRERQGGHVRSPLMSRLRSPLMEPLMDSYIPLVNGAGGWDEEHDMGVSGDAWWTPSDLERVIAEKHQKIENDMLPFPFPEDIERTLSDLKAIDEKQNTISNDMWSFPGQVDVQRSRPVIPEAPLLPDMGAVRYARPPRAPTVGEEKGVVEVHWEASLDDEWWDMAEDVDQGEDDDIYSLISDGEGWQL